jgi:hypothetical protein
MTLIITETASANITVVLLLLQLLQLLLLLIKIVYKKSLNDFSPREIVIEGNIILKSPKYLHKNNSIKFYNNNNNNNNNNKQKTGIQTYLSRYVKMKI